MKESVKAYLRSRFKNLDWDKDAPEEEVDPLAHWPDIKVCVDSYYNSRPEMKRYHSGAIRPAGLGCTEVFMKSLNKYCTTRSLRLRLLDAVAKIVYRIPSPGLRDAPIKEKPGLWHFYISASWRVFYRKTDDDLLFEEFCPHKKITYHRRR